MGTIAVIGAGASGIIAALKASERNHVYLLDGNDKCGKKILLTGNGRCNYWNSELNSQMYESDCEDNLNTIIAYGNTVLSYLNKLGLYPKIKNGYYYPYSNQAASVREIFQKKISDSNIDFKTNFKVENIVKKGGQFIITSAEGNFLKCDKVIIATGSKAAPKTGSDGSGYSLAEKLGHRVNTVTPALCGLTSNAKFLKEWEKIRCDARVTLFVGNSPEKEDVGEIQLTSNGISGICTFNISGIASKSIAQGKTVSVWIDFMPHIGDIYLWFNERSELLKECTIEQMLESVFNYKLMFVLLKVAGISKDDKWERMTELKRLALCKIIKEFDLRIIGTESFEKAQVCTGGVALSEINPNTMESAFHKDLYFAGEVLDVDGRCGGYNLAFAFISGYIAGDNV